MKTLVAVFAVMALRLTAAEAETVTYTDARGVSHTTSNPAQITASGTRVDITR